MRDFSLQQLCEEGFESSESVHSNAIIGAVHAAEQRSRC
jgi:hypothetical protein